jgi:hypothetical protein
MRRDQSHRPGPYRAQTQEDAGRSEPPRIQNRPVPRQWEPIVVDLAAEPFEPRPTTGRCPPDTICDGWSTKELTVRMASSRGAAHRYAGTPRQDHAVMAIHPPSAALLFAVMDGVSAATRSHEGAEEVGHSVLRTVWTMMSNAQRIDWKSVFQTAADDLSRYPVGGREAGPDAERLLATTVVAGVVSPTPDGPLAQLARVGDSGAWWLRGREFRPLFSGKVSGGTIASTVEPLPRVPVEVESVEIVLSRDAALIVATDGIGDPLGDGTGLVGELLAEVLATPPPILGLAHAIDFSRETFDDDRTLLAVWGRSR